MDLGIKNVDKESGQILRIWTFRGKIWTKIWTNRRECGQILLNWTFRVEIWTKNVDKLGKCGQI